MENIEYIFLIKFILEAVVHRVVQNSVISGVLNGMLVCLWFLADLYSVRFFFLVGITTDWSI